MAATVEIKVYTDTNAATESSGDTTTLNLMSADSNDSTGSVYHSNRIIGDDTGTVYSYERWIRLKFTSFTTITNIKAYHSSGSLRDGSMDLLAGTTTNGVTPVNTASSVATTTLADWDSAAEAIDITPSGGISSSPGFSKYFVMQLKVESGRSVPGDLGSQGLTFTYDET